tara:strand:- start:1342 stop:1572 length:231 start_codon:yes stop_codon:yes gene_type:complete
MVFQLIARQNTNTLYFPLEGDPYQYMASIGAYAITRAKRDGRNPSTGARTSRKYWNRMRWTYDCQPLTDLNGNPIY